MLKRIFDVVAVGAGCAKSSLYTLIKLSIQDATIVVAIVASDASTAATHIV